MAGIAFSQLAGFDPRHFVLSCGQEVGVLTLTPRAKYREIFTRFADRIHTGALPPGTRLPTERALAGELAVDRTTVATAYAELEAAGLVQRRQGSGTFVTGDLWGLAPDWTRYIAGSAFRPTAPLHARLRAGRRQPGVIDISEGVLADELVPHDLLRDVLAGGAMPETFGYPVAQGDALLRERISTDMSARQSIAVDPDSLLITAGAQQALYLIARALLSPGDAVAIEQPSYFYALPLFQACGIRLFPLPMDEQGLDPQAIKPLYQRHRVRMVITNPTFQNPTSVTLSAARREALLAVCRTLNIPVVEDDVYSDLALDQLAPPPLKALDRENRVLYIGTLSKIATPGLRIGWIAGPKPVLEHLAEVKHQMDFGTGAFGQALAAGLLAHPGWPAHLARLRTALRSRRDALVAALRAHLADAATFTPPAGGLHLWLRWNAPQDDRRLLEAALAGGVAFTPGRIYGMPDGYARLTFARAPEADLPEAVRRLAAALTAPASR